MALSSVYEILVPVNEPAEFVASLIEAGHVTEAVATQQVQFAEGFSFAFSGWPVHWFEPAARQAGHRAGLRTLCASFERLDLR